MFDIFRKLNKLLLFLLLISFFYACKKSNTVAEDYSGDLPQSVFYKFIATIPSPADSALGRFKDSLKINFTRKIASPDYLINYDYNRLGAYLNDRFLGFSFGYQKDGSQFPCFTFVKNAFPTVPYNFELNRPYEISVSNDQTCPIFLGTQKGDGGMNYFVNNNYPPDGTSPKYDYMVKVVFSKRKIYSLNNNDVLTMDGEISGYIISKWGTVNPDKYMMRWDFTVTFSGLKADK